MTNSLRLTASSIALRNGACLVQGSGNVPTITKRVVDPPTGANPFSLGNLARMAVDESEFPEGEGTVTVSWRVSIIEGRKRLGWRYEGEPRLDARLAIALLRDVASELEEDLPT